MIDIFIVLFTGILFVICLLMGIVILMQRANTSGGLGAAFGGGMAESAFGADTGSVLSKVTVGLAVGFFILSLSLYLLHMGKISAAAEEAEAQTDVPSLPTINTPADIEQEVAEAQDALAGGATPMEEEAVEAEDAPADDVEAKPIDEAVEAAAEELDGLEPAPQPATPAQ